MDVILRLRHRRSGDSQRQETFLAFSADKQNQNYDIECSDHHPLLSTLSPKGLSRSEMKWWAIHTNLPVDVIVRLPHPRSGDSQGQKKILAPSGDKETRDYDIEFSNQYPSVSTLRPNGLSRSKMKWWAVCTNLPADVIVRQPHPWSGDSQGQEMFLAPSADKSTRNYDIECSNHHPSLSTERPKTWRSSQMKWLGIYTNLAMDVRIGLPHPRRGDSQRQETFLARSDDKSTRNYDIDCSNQHPSLSTLSPKGLSRSKMKWGAINSNLPVDVIVRLPHPPSGDSQNQKRFWPSSAEKPTRNYDIECSNHHPSLSTLSPKGLSHSKVKCWSIHTNLPVHVIIRLPHPPMGNSQGQETFLAAKKSLNDDIECSNQHP